MIDINNKFSLLKNKALKLSCHGLADVVASEFVSIKRLTLNKETISNLSKGDFSAGIVCELSKDTKCVATFVQSLCDKKPPCPSGVDFSCVRGI